MNHVLWPRFVIFADENNISLSNKVDWEAWWDCFLAGAQASRQYEHSQEMK